MKTFEFVTTDYDYVVLIAEFYNKFVAESCINFLTH